jgi:hypothetical protein
MNCRRWHYFLRNYTASHKYARWPYLLGKNFAQKNVYKSREQKVAQDLSLLYGVPLEILGESCTMLFSSALSFCAQLQGLSDGVFFLASLKGLLGSARMRRFNNLIQGSKFDSLLNL